MWQNLRLAICDGISKPHLEPPNQFGTYRLSHHCLCFHQGVSMIVESYVLEAYIHGNQVAEPQMRTLMRRHSCHPLLGCKIGPDKAKVGRLSGNSTVPPSSQVTYFSGSIKKAEVLPVMRPLVVQTLKRGLRDVNGEHAYQFSIAPASKSCATRVSNLGKGYSSWKTCS